MYYCTELANGQLTVKIVTYIFVKLSTYMFFYVNFSAELLVTVHLNFLSDYI